MAGNGFDRIFFNDAIHVLKDWEPDLNPSELNVVVDRVMLRPRDRSRILDSLEQAYRFGSDRLDIWIRPSAENAARVHEALSEFGAPVASLSVEDLADEDIVYQMGLPPSRIDILTSIAGVSFEEAWQERVESR